MISGISVVEPDPDPPGSEIIFLSGAGPEKNIGSSSGMKLILEIIMFPSLELTLHY
jgi:hypothetical protein